MPEATPEASPAQVSEHDSYELPDELDFTKLRPIGFGIEKLDEYVADHATPPRQARLAPDVAAVFKTDEEVNAALRTIIQAARQIEGRVA
jgi:hypothetical protein